MTEIELIGSARSALVHLAVLGLASRLDMSYSFCRKSPVLPAIDINCDPAA